MALDQKTAAAIAMVNNIPLHQDFHALGSDTVTRIVDAAKAYGYRKPKNANGSTGRYFYAYLCRAENGPKWSTEYVVQGNYGYGYEDECAEETMREARQRLREYRENGPGTYRLITRKVKNF